jgi:hypothetical protein
MRGVQQHHERRMATEVWDRINTLNFSHTRCTLKLIKLILLFHDTDCNILNGSKVIFKKKSLGAGVYEVWMEVDK